ncbi:MULTISPECIES: type II secretion system ATPase GspE [Xanthomonas]|uniref:Type II secretion system protein E n=1 Tax=Xanthomonas rydalmerensis TaxID=3046274 RepID=A0ABZ0JLG4_9XANT|nr:MULTISPECIES: type II secretion system ATPase GspE [unclassified Xanthomonas]WOS40261.1 type II secretion system ATPase GspE [Xanthomonas sp. DM-2023]WOS44445.1 type II secretion system ATPase GspE [Xanthomonas sp. DM-2023]WOS48625.1 type II secretion system ATPase GspE [Xanthomonas sp. DM-2023]WOS52805.1 type II secretion system ATPase GspE [Xanthomonas sp. DM-2023]WOS56989.1 type II secretion system ATPase GspE [Xanthomonas sp. DM-2023]
MNALVKDTVVAVETPETRIIAALLAKGRLKDGDLARARQLQRESGGSLLALLARLGLVSERDHAELSAEVLGLPLLDAKQLPATAPESLPEAQPLSLRFLKQFHVCPLGERDGVLELWMADPHDAYAADAVRLATGLQVLPRVGLRSEIDDLIERWFGQGRSAMGAIVETADGDSVAADDIEHLRDLASEAPVIRLVNLVIQRAVELRASDIHIEPFESRLKVRYRVDGVLIDGESPPANLTAAVISRVKIMAKLNIAERRLPQDGRIMLRVQGKELDLRVSTVPTAHGESVVMRLLDRETVVFDFHRLGFTDAFLPQFRKVLEQPHGILLVTGPTGSGKTTTLYTALSQLNTADVKIITVEDPVEYQIEGINQIQAKPQIGLDFSHALRSIVRQDPDIIMIGEMRDLETARIAIQSALTGHLVLSTLHTNNAAGGITRLLDMGVEDYLLTSTINGILAQRLVRRLEPTHAERYAASPEEIEKFELRRLQPEGEIFLYRPRPSAIAPTGYVGRTTIMEFLVMNDALRRAVMRHAGMGEIEQLAREAGMRTMYEDGLSKALSGQTTIEEVLRVTEET